MRNFLGTKSWRNFLEGLKRKIDIFIGTKNIFNPYEYKFKWETTNVGLFLRQLYGSLNILVMRETKIRQARRKLYFIYHRDSKSL